MILKRFIELMARSPDLPTVARAGGNAEGFPQWVAWGHRCAVG